MSKVVVAPIKLDEEDFRCLVSGGTLTVHTPVATVMLILADIGFDRMDKAILDVDSQILPAYSSRTRNV